MQLSAQHQDAGKLALDMRFHACLMACIAVMSFSKLDPSLAPPMGWRSWNCFLNEIDQSRILGQIFALNKSPLLAAGFNRIGIDGGWVCMNTTDSLACQCGGVGGSYHDKNGNPVVSALRFPNLTELVVKAHQHGILLDWYGNSCNCASQEWATWHSDAGGNSPNVMHDVTALMEFGFDGIKVDGCSPEHNISQWVEALAALDGPPLLLENCGNNGPKRWSPPDPASLAKHTCGFQMYRVSADIAPQFYSTMYNLQAMVPYQNLSRPGCWSYPDMLQLGNANLTTHEAKTHFAAWAISSAPLIIGFDLTDDAKMTSSLPILSNPSALAINQLWAGHAGGMAKSSSEQFVALTAHGAAGSNFKNVTFPIWQVWAKPQPHGRVALLLINLAPDLTRDISINLSDLSVLGLDGAAVAYKVIDVWSGMELPSPQGGTYTAKAVPPHASAFVILTPQ
jgi:hypothetical protein